MKIIKNCPPKSTSRYDFSKVRPGDAVDVENWKSAATMFRIWRNTNDKPNWFLSFGGRSPDNPKLYRLHVRERVN